MAGFCGNRDCPVALTGKCVLGHEALTDCPNYSDSAEATEKKSTEPAVAAQASPAARTFHPGNELGTDDAAEIMCARYGTLVAVLGHYNVGKTCFLASLYLLAACRSLGPDLEFAGSLTLPGLNSRAKRLRRWANGALPDQLADHTVLADDRVPALVHIALRERTGARRRYDLLLTDLPGEWSRDLVKDAGTAGRFRFLARADGLVLVLDGPKFSGNDRHAELHSTEILLSRIAEMNVLGANIPLVLMVSKFDELAGEVPRGVAKVAERAVRLGFAPKIIPVAAISRDPNKIKSGTGVVEVLEHILVREAPAAQITIAEPPVAGARAFERVRGHRD